MKYALMQLMGVALALAMTACAAPNRMPRGASYGQMDGVASLATIGTCEYEVAPLYTRNAVARRNAARDLERGRIGASDAKKIQATADAARALLDRACPKGPQAKEVDRDVVGRVDALLKGIAR